jgi:hypothetical protein
MCGGDSGVGWRSEAAGGDMRLDYGPGGMTWLAVSSENWLVGCSSYVVYDSCMAPYYTAATCNKDSTLQELVN